jgi:nucleotide-binding universal stress UspA family protein
MTSFFVATDSVHTTAATCDYLQDRLGDGDTVVVCSVAAEGAARDPGDACNVARVRLGATASVDTATRAGDPVAELTAAIAEADPDEIVIGQRGGTPAASSDLGGTAQALLARIDRPVVVLPVPDLD